MPRIFFPAILYPADENGLHGVVVPGINVNVSGEDASSALAEATQILQDVIDHLVARGEEIPPPADPTAVDVGDGGLVLLPATLPGRSVRLNITMDEELVRRIDAVAANRSGFLARAAQAMLAAG